MTRSVIVVGGGISGLTAAWRLRDDAEVTVLEGGPRIGGKLRTGTLAGVPVDEGAESLMALRPEAVRLAQDVGLGAELCDPAPAPTTLWSGGALRPLPRGHVMGIPTEPEALTGTGLLSEEGAARLRHEEALPAEALTEDVSVAEYLGGRLGQEAVDRLVEPLLGGVYAGRPDRLSLRAVLPRVAAIAERGEPLLSALRRTRTPPGATRSPGVVPVQGLRGGTGRLPRAVAEASGARILTGTRARELQRTAAGRWRVLAVTSDGPLLLEADAVVLAVPAYEAAELLRPHAPLADADLGAIQHASTAVVTMAFPRTKALARGDALPEGNGFLVPAIDGHTIKAATFLSTKWGWQGEAAPDVFLLRTSIGRVCEEHRLDVPDRHLVRSSVIELHQALGSIGEPVAARVTRWERGLPQYGVGHKERIARVREAVGKLAGIQLCGAAYEGVGVAACVSTGTGAALALAEG
ncbi:protoporphyrinogen oxidase [Streptomyces formicae]|uniref:Coproporphyrinogen III oxidase n=1 Tax=Streptomyces formicae TaxID=1616117 RepID=A0A291QF26_9ACTN|nr:protoporphyrinogen oxidase [Streptomyces formicae]ATL30311.1 Protoporphyrinogen IX oxidase, aerobic, HemY [Streptomyces formicae]